MVADAPSCGDVGGWPNEARGWLQRLQSVAANEVLLVAASGKGRSRRSAARWVSRDKIMIYEVMYIWRRVVRVIGVGAGKLRYLLVASGSAPDIPARLKKLKFLLVALGRAPDIPARIL